MGNESRRTRRVAQRAGFQLERHPSGEMLVAGFDMGEGRRQTVYVTYLGQTPDGKDIVSAAAGGRGSHRRLPVVAPGARAQDLPLQEPPALPLDPGRGR